MRIILKLHKFKSCVPSFVFNEIKQDCIQNYIMMLLMPVQNINKIWSIHCIVHHKFILLLNADFSSEFRCKWWLRIGWKTTWNVYHHKITNINRITKIFSTANRYYLSISSSTLLSIYTCVPFASTDCNVDVIRMMQNCMLLFSLLNTQHNCS